MNSKEVAKAAKELLQNFERYRHYAIKYDATDMEQRLEKTRKETMDYFVKQWILGILCNTLRTEECAKKLTAKNAESFKQIYPNIHSKKSHLIDDKSVAKRLGLSENTIKTKKKAIFKEIIEMQNTSH